MKIHIKNYIAAYGVPTACEWCGRNNPADIHHIIFKSQGGGNEVDNLIALCRDCHDRSHFKKEPYITSEELFKRKGHYGISR
jgi:5-methylcytosine-specific restriction endonuclease McrA